MHAIASTARYCNSIVYWKCQNVYPTTSSLSVLFGIRARVHMEGVGGGEAELKGWEYKAHESAHWPQNPLQPPPSL